jgi:hypothetical protein
MVFAGVGAGKSNESLILARDAAELVIGVNELTALAVTSELAPVADRGKYVAVLVFSIVPFVPSVLYAQLIAYHSNWRYIGVFCGVWAFIGLVMTAVFYFPPPRANSEFTRHASSQRKLTYAGDGMSRKEILRRIDYLGGLLSISGMICFVSQTATLSMYPH